MALYLNKNLSYPYNLAEHIFEGDEKLPLVLPMKLESVIEDTLTERECKIVDLRYSKGCTYEVIANEIGVGRERIRQIIARSIRKLRHHHRVAKFLATPNEEVSLRLAEKDSKIKKLTAEIEYLRSISDVPILEEKDTDEDSSCSPKTIISLDLSVRSTNCLSRRGIKTLQDFEGMRLIDLMHIRNLGKRSYNEIIEKLKGEGFSIVGDPVDVDHAYLHFSKP